MTPLFLGLYGVYLILVAVRGNGSALLDLLNRDTSGYMPWLFAIIVLAVLNEFETTEPIVKPIIGLLVLNFFLRNANTVKSQVQQIYSGT
jgi:hypothetical protein